MCVATDEKQITFPDLDVTFRIARSLVWCDCEKEAQECPTPHQAHRHPQRKAVEECPPGAVMVMDSRKDPRAASAVAGR